LKELPKLRFHEKSCQTCRYFRIHKSGCYTIYKSGCYTSSCLFLGRDLGITNNYNNLPEWAKARVCDGWKRRPHTWLNVLQEKNPYWFDEYIPRESLLKIRKRAGDKD